MNFSLPPGVHTAIDRYYASPIKVANNGEKHDISSSALRRCEAEALASIVYNLQPKRSLEIGLASGGSAVAIAAARADRRLLIPHVALDPYQEEWAHNVGLTELDKLGLREHVDWQPEFSENYLSAVYAKGLKFDFVFVDGGHDIGQKVTDAFYIGKVLNPGGVVAFHDGLFFSTSVAVRHLVTECGYEILQLPTDDSTKRLARSVRHAPRLGLWYAAQIIPSMCRSLVALRKSR